VKEKKQKQHLRELGLKDTYYYDGYGARTTTICLLVQDTTIVARGVALCSPLDQFNKQVGRAKALGQAIKAALSHETSGLFYLNCKHPLYLTATKYGHRSVYYPQPFEYEAKVLSILQSLKKKRKGEKVNV